MIDIATVLQSLSLKRPVFHSEADFQHALAWEICLQWPMCSMRLERRPPNLKERIYLDLWVANEETTLAIELKYKTRGLRTTIAGETFALADQAAQDLARYDFLKDVQRLEQVVANHEDIVGYAVFLTNDSAYWKIPPNNQTVDAAFRIHEGRLVSGQLSWEEKASQGTTAGRVRPILLAGTYHLSWLDYSIVGNMPYGKFRYLLVQVNPQLENNSPERPGIYAQRSKRYYSYYRLITRQWE